MADQPKVLRCAVYTRKSSDEGLEQEFNSLHAQREACEAYVVSQRHEGWRLVPKVYDDGGFSGGSMERPALKLLLGDIAAGLVDVIVVYKIDRLTRSLHDFSRIVEVLDGAKASFVSITQAFNTTTSMGRLTLNVLLSFAQFEREVTGERIRDKIAASKAKGMWMGGYRPLGYRIEGRDLKPHPQEATVIAELFQRFISLGSVDALIEAASDHRLFEKLERRSDKPMSRGALYHLLQNPLYVGDIRHKALRHPGRHDGIVTREVFEAVQQGLQTRRRVRAEGERSRTPALLTGLIFDQEGRRFTPSHTLRRGRVYSYYSLTEATDASAVRRLPAKSLEASLKTGLLDAIKTPATVLAMLDDLGAEASKSTLDALSSWSDIVRAATAAEQRTALRGVIKKVVVLNESVGLELTLSPILGPHHGATIKLNLPMALTRRGGELKLVVATGNANLAPDERLATVLARGVLWFDQLKRGVVKTREELAAREGVSAAYVGHLLELAFLAPDLKRDILLGRQPPELTAVLLKQMCPLPGCWKTQRTQLAALCREARA